MRHRNFGKKLGRNHHQRQALFQSLVRAIFTHGSIETTETKAKSIIPTIESLSNTIITKPDLFARRELFRYLQDRNWVNNVFKTFKEVFGQQTKNFTKISRVGRRYGDDALVVKLSFVKPIKFVLKPEKPVEKTKKGNLKSALKVKTKPEKAVKPKLEKKVKKETK